MTAVLLFELKLRFALKPYAVTRCGVCELYRLGVEHQSLGTVAVDVVTHDWRAETLGVCRVNT